MGRKDISMTDGEVQDFLTSGAKVLQVATIDANGYPHQAPMWFVVEDGLVVFRSFSKSQKIVNLARNPKVSLLVETGDFYAELQGVSIRGTAELITDRQRVLDVYQSLAARYPFVGTEPVVMDAAAVEQAFGRFADKNTVVVVHPDKVATWDHTKLGGVY